MSLRLFHHESIDSTQNEALRLLDQKKVPPFLVTTDLQTAGRGRLDREWHFEKTRSLAFSLVLRLRASDLAALSLIVGYAIADFLKAQQIQIKWPNDLMIEDQKIGGILIESRSVGDSADVVIGVGLNLLPLQSASYASLKQKVNAEELAGSIMHFVEGVISRGGFKPIRNDFEKKLWKNSSAIKILGVSDEGFLVTEQDGKRELMINGEIAVI